MSPPGQKGRLLPARSAAMSCTRPEARPPWAMAAAGPADLWNS